MKMEKLDLFCPACGVLGIWQDKHDAGDYYQGTPMWCFACNKELPDIIIRDPYDARQGEHGKAFWSQRFEALRDAALAVGGEHE